MQSKDKGRNIWPCSIYSLRDKVRNTSPQSRSTYPQLGRSGGGFLPLLLYLDSRKHNYSILLFSNLTNDWYKTTTLGIDQWHGIYSPWVSTPLLSVHLRPSSSLYRPSSSFLYRPSSSSSRNCSLLLIIRSTASCL